MTTTYAIFVTMQLKKGLADAFRPHILKNAETARRVESDCLLFNVMVAEDDPDRFHFYEVYTSEAALAAHRQTPHFQAYAAATKDMVAERTVVGCHVIDQ